MLQKTCEFCQELEHDPSSRFATAYAPVGYPSRVLHEVGGYVILPTLGPLTPGSLLILPRRHRETLACPGPEPKSALSAALDWALSFTAERTGRQVVFEHGARRPTGGGCGIYHAHAHIIPVSKPVLAVDVLGEGSPAESMSAALDQLHCFDAYLWFTGTDGDIRTLDISDRLDDYPSQYFRRRIAERVGRAEDWDWRDRAQPEDDVLAILAPFLVRA